MVHFSSGRVLMRRRQSVGDDPARHRVTSITSSSETLTLVKLVAQILMDSDISTDAGVILDVVSQVRAIIAQGRIDSREMAILHGDTNAQDTLASWTMGSRYTAGDLAGTDALLGSWIGIRAHAFDNSATVAGGGTFDAADHFDALKKMGVHAAGAHMAVGLNGFYSQILANALFTTVDKAGAAATLQTGQLGQVGDTPIDLTDFLASEYASTGLYTGSGATNTFAYYAPEAWVLYVNASNEKEWDVVYPERSAQYVGTQEEVLLDSNEATGEVVASVIINL